MGPGHLRQRRQRPRRRPGRQRGPAAAGHSHGLAAGWPHAHPHVRLRLERHHHRLGEPGRRHALHRPGSGAGSGRRRGRAGPQGPARRLLRRGPAQAGEGLGGGELRSLVLLPQPALRLPLLPAGRRPVPEHLHHPRVCHRRRPAAGEARGQLLHPRPVVQDGDAPPQAGGGGGGGHRAHRRRLHHARLPARPGRRPASRGRAAGRLQVRRGALHARLRGRRRLGRSSPRLRQLSRPHEVRLRRRLQHRECGGGLHPAAAGRHRRPPVRLRRRPSLLEQLPLQPGLPG